MASTPPGSQWCRSTAWRRRDGSTAVYLGGPAAVDSAGTFHEDAGYCRPSWCTPPRQDPRPASLHCSRNPRFGGWAHCRDWAARPSETTRTATGQPRRDDLIRMRREVIAELIADESTAWPAARPVRATYSTPDKPAPTQVLVFLECFTDCTTQT